jgi:transposase
MIVLANCQGHVTEKILCEEDPRRVRIGREAVYSFLCSRRCDERKKGSPPVSLHPQAAYPIPEETARIARAAFPNGNPLMLLRDELGMFAIDQEFAALFPPRGQPAVSPSRLFFITIMITIMQFMEGLTDRQAADAVRSRIDWKYALGLPLTDAGFDFSVLSEFRARLLQEEQAQACLTRLLTVCQARGWR